MLCGNQCIVVRHHADVFGVFINVPDNLFVSVVINRWVLT